MSHASDKQHYDGLAEERLRELEWAATYVKTTPARRCRCAGSCPECRERTKALKKIGPNAVLELVRTVEHAHLALSGALTAIDLGDPVSAREFAATVRRSFAPAPERPAYNHTRSDSPLTPCPECDRSQKASPLASPSREGRSAP